MTSDWSLISGTIFYEIRIFFCFFILWRCQPKPSPPRSTVFFLGAHPLKISTPSRHLVPLFPSSLPVIVARPLATSALHHWQIALSSAVFYAPRDLPSSAHFDFLCGACQCPLSQSHHSRLSLANLSIFNITYPALIFSSLYSNQHTVAAFIFLKAYFLSTFVADIA